MVQSIAPALNALVARQELSDAALRDVFEALFDQAVAPEQVAGFLIGLRVRGETASELAAACAAMRARMVRVEAPSEAIDVCGTGGDGRNTLNISTAAALVVAACGVPVAKHGNRAASSQAGSTDVLEALGVVLLTDPAANARLLREAGITYLSAPDHHPAVAAVMPVRRALGVRTLFNLTGPMCNPAQVRRQLIGVADPAHPRLLGETLRQLGCDVAWVVHGADGLDELSTTGVNQIVRLFDGQVTAGQLDPTELGLPRTTLADLAGGDVNYNAAAIQRLLAGERGAYHDIVCLNAGAALAMAHNVSVSDGVGQASATLASGAVRTTLARWVALSKDYAA
jgi:anthranilate phosphoribosyltransferase